LNSIPPRCAWMWTRCNRRSKWRTTSSAPCSGARRNCTRWNNRSLPARSVNPNLSDRRNSRMKSSWRIASWLLVAGLTFLAASVRADTSDVFRLDIGLQGVIEGGVTSNSTIEKVKIRDVDLINLAQGRTLGTPVPKNEVL